MRTIGFTGTRRGMSSTQQSVLRDILGVFARRGTPVTVHHGDCLGADNEFHTMTSIGMGLPVVIHPPVCRTARAFCIGLSPTTNLKPLPYIERNHAIVAACDLLIACPGENKPVRRSGTWATIRHAEKVGRRTLIIFPDGQRHYLNVKKGKT